MIAEGFEDFQPIFRDVVSGKSLLDGFIDVSEVSDAVGSVVVVVVVVDVVSFSSLPGYIYIVVVTNLIISRFLRNFGNYDECIFYPSQFFSFSFRYWLGPVEALFKTTSRIFLLSFLNILGNTPIQSRVKKLYMLFSSLWSLELLYNI